MDRNTVLAKIWEAYESGGFVPTCAWCRRVCVDGEWVELEAGALSTIDAPMTLSHTICPDCTEAQLGQR